RDDLNITSNTNGEYSSHPFVLLSYTEADGRPAMRPFKVLREKPSQGITFNYLKPAGAILQPPMPLPLLEKPRAPNMSGEPPKNLNPEIAAWTVGASSNSAAGAFANTTLTTTERNYFTLYQPLAVQSPAPIGAPFWVFPTSIGSATVKGWLATN